MTSAFSSVLLFECLLCLYKVDLSSAGPALSGQYGEVRCAGGYSEGQTVDRGRYWYRCERGYLTPMGCFSDDRTRLEIGGSFKTRGYVLQCILEPSGDLSFKYKGCLNDKQEEIEPNGTWQDKRYWYLCLVKGDHLISVIGGCVEANVRYGIGATVEKKGFLYECRRYANNTGSMCPVACVHNNKRYNIDDTFEVGKYWYTCTIYHGRLAKVCVGCMHRTRRLKDGDRYFQRDSVFQCEVRNNTDPEHRLIGCRDDLPDGSAIERKLGCVWTVGTYPSQYLMQCVSRHNRAVKEVIKCYYKSFEMEPGCFRVIVPEVVTCRKNNGALMIEQFNAATDLAKVANSHLKYCCSPENPCPDAAARLITSF